MRHSKDYTLIGSEESPYSVKVRSYLRYKAISHKWKMRGSASEELEKYARLPLIPLVVTPDGTGLQDSTPLVETLEGTFPDPSIHPDEPILKFVSSLLEEFGDEWGNKWMFHFRWARVVDQIGCSQRIAEQMIPDASPEQLSQASKRIRERMVRRLWFVGSSSQTAPLIEKSFEDMLNLLETHFVAHTGWRFLFGNRPAFGDFSLWGQFYSANRDHTPATYIGRCPRVRAWIKNMLVPHGSGEFASWSEVADTVRPILKEQVAGLFLPWSSANAKAVENGKDEFEVKLANGAWRQRPQKYPARSLAMLKNKFDGVRHVSGLTQVLEETGCLPFLDP